MPGVPISGLGVVTPRPVHQVQGRLQLLYKKGNETFRDNSYKTYQQNKDE